MNKKDCPCYSHIKKIGRASWICDKCKRDVSLEVILAYDAEIDLLKVKKEQDVIRNNKIVE